MADKVGRREFIKLAAAGTAVTVIARRVKANSRGEDASDSAHRWAMVIDQAKCVGCAECSLACQAHNDTPPDAPWNRMIELEPINGEPVYAPPTLYAL